MSESELHAVLETYERAIKAAGVEPVPSDRVSAWFARSHQAFEEETEKFGTPVSDQWNALVADFRTPGVYILMWWRSRTEMTLYAGVGPALKEFLDEHWGEPFAETLLVLAARFGPLVWEARVPLDAE